MNTELAKLEEHIQTELNTDLKIYGIENAKKQKINKNTDRFAE